MARLSHLTLQLIICTTALHLAEPVVAENIRTTDDTKKPAEPMTYNEWYAFCTFVDKEFQERIRNGDIVNANIQTEGVSHAIKEAFKDFAALVSVFARQCEYIEDLSGVEPHASNVGQPDAQQKLDSAASIIGRGILVAFVNMQNAYDTYIVVRKCEDVEISQRGAVEYLKHRVMNTSPDGFAYMVATSVS